MRKLKSSKIFLATIMSLIICCVSIIPALAYTSSPNKYATVFGKNYRFTSEVWERMFNSGNTVEAVTSVNSDSGNVPSGYMGGQARLYTESGVLKLSSGYVYNNVSAAGFYVYSSRTTMKGTYYAYCSAKFYNGNGYTEYQGYKSPNWTLRNNNDAMMISEYDMNSKGETYGSALSAYTIGQEPDLISAIGVGDTEGYVRAIDLQSNPTTPEEAISLSCENNSSRTIPLYDKEGNEIGEFLLETNYVID